MLMFFLPTMVFAQYDYIYKSLEEVKCPDSVYVLSLTKQKLDTFPIQILEYRNLRELDLSKNRIKFLPKDIYKLENLEVLNMDRNRLQYLPAEIGLLSKLKVLRLSRNRLYDLPDEIGTLSNLKQLILWSNGIKTFPSTFANLNGTIEFIDLRDSPMMLYDDQQAIKEMLPKPQIKMDKVCNCR